MKTSKLATPLKNNMKLGLSPSDLTDFFHIKEQINYLSRADKTTDWKIVKRLSEKLLAENGVDLQTLVYLTVANDKLSSNVHQLNYDIEVLAIALVSYWDEIWPQDISVRITILNWLNRQISQSVRQYHLTKQNSQDYFKLSNSLSLITSTLAMATGGDASHLTYLLDFVTQEINRFNTDRNLLPLELASQTQQNTIKPVIPTPKAKPTNKSAEPVVKTLQEEASIPQIPPRKLEMPTLQAVENSPQFAKKEANTRPKRSLWHYLLGGFIAGMGLSVAIFYGISTWYHHQLNKQLETVIDSPNELVNAVYLSFGYQHDEIKRKLQDKADNYRKQGHQFIQLDGVTPKLAKLQSDLLQAEKNKQGLTLSYLKTSLYEIEKELNTMNCLECDIFRYQTNTNDPVLAQSLNHRILSLLFYYQQLSAQEKQRQQND